MICVVVVLGVLILNISFFKNKVDKLRVLELTHARLETIEIAFQTFQSRIDFL